MSALGHRSPPSIRMPQPDERAYSLAGIGLAVTNYRGTAGAIRESSVKIQAMLAVSLCFASGLAAGKADAALTTPQPKPVVSCPSFVDPSKDDQNSKTAKVGQAAEDPALDIVRTTESVRGGVLTVAIRVVKLGNPSVADGVHYAAGFTAGGKRVELFGTISRSAPVIGAAFALTGITVDGSYVNGTSKKVALAQASATNTVSLSVSLADVEAAARSKFGSTLATDLQSNTMATYGVLLEPYDTSAPTKPLKLPMTGCR